MAVTTSAININRDRKQFHGAFVEQWFVEMTLAFAAVGDGAEDTGTATVAGLDVSKGDAVIAYGFNADAEENIFFYQVYVSADNTLAISVTNTSASNDTPGPTKMWVLIGRPAWNPGT